MSDMNMTGRLSLETNGAAQSLLAIREKLSGTVEKIKAVGFALTGLGAAFGALRSSESVVEGLQGVFEKAHDLERVSRMTGESVKDLVVLMKGFKTAGMDSSADSVSHSLSLLQKALGGINAEGLPTKAVFDQLHLSVDKLKSLPAIDQLEQIGERIRQLPNPAEKAAAAAQLFGREGAYMLAILNDSTALSTAAKSAGALGDVYERNAAVFGKMAVLFETIKGKANALFAGLAEQVAPVLLPLMQQLASLDFLKWGQQIGQAVGVLVEAFKEGKFGELFGASLKLGAIDAVNFVNRALQSVMAALAAGFGALFDQLAQPGIFASFGLGLVAGIAGVAGKITSLLLRAFKGPLDFLQAGMEYAAQELLNILLKVPGMKKALGIDEVHRSFDEIYRDRKEEGPSLFGSNADQFDKEGSQYLRMAREGLGSVDFGKVFSAAKDALQASFKQAGNVMDPTAAQNAFQAIYDALLKNLPKAPEEAAPPTGPKNALEAVGKIPRINSDDLARVGGFIGGNGGPALDYSRKTASATQATAAGVDAINKNGVKVVSITGEVVPGWGA